MITAYETQSLCAGKAAGSSYALSAKYSRGPSLRPDWVLGLPRLLVSGSRRLGAESSGGGCEFRPGIAGA